MPGYAPNPVYGARQYEILVAQKANPLLEVQSLDDAAHVLRYSMTTEPSSQVPVYPSVEETLVRLARSVMVDDERAARFHAYSGVREVTYEEYWHEVARLGASYTTLGGRPRSEPSSWYQYLYYGPRTAHPLLHGQARQLDVLRHTAHPDEVNRHMGWAGSTSLSLFVAEAAAYGMSADAAEQAGGGPAYRPNAVEGRECRTSERHAPYPCSLQRLADFQDVSYETDAPEDALEFRIGARFYVLFVGPRGYLDLKYKLASIGYPGPSHGPPEYEELEQLMEAAFELETNDEAELLGYLGARMREASRLGAVR